MVAKRSTATHSAREAAHRKTRKASRSRGDATDLTADGTFAIGCNYWASHAGTHMWSDWREDVVAADLEQLAGAGLRLLRVFPIWSVFQPISLLRSYRGGAREVRFGEDPLPDTPAGRAGVEESALDKFRRLADLAQEQGLKLLVGLVTGWMSGRLFVPPALEGLNLHTDPLAVMWQVRFVRHFVRTFRNHPAVVGWNLGNECNCLADAGSREAAWAWTAQIAHAIRAEDATRPVVSGMHSLEGAEQVWTIEDQAELTDVLTTHPYPVFTPHCDRDPVNTLRNGLHATAQSLYYAGVGGRKCLAEEFGTLGPFVAADDVAGDYVRTSLLSLWSHGLTGLLWWCAYDQGHLPHAPYDWNAGERELGLSRADRTLKPVGEELGRFAKMLGELPRPSLPPHETEGVCILTLPQDRWGAAYSSFVLAKQAGFDIVFRHADQPLPDAPLYLMPSVRGGRNPTARRWRDLLERVRAGATLYVSLDDARISGFAGIFGMELRTRCQRTRPAVLDLAGVEGAGEMAVASDIRMDLSEAGAEVLAREADGNPALTCHRYGKGRVYLLTVPVERRLAETPGAFDADAAPWWRLYRHVAAKQVRRRAVRTEHPAIGLTEHRLDAKSRVVVAINYGPTPMRGELTLSRGWRVAESWLGAAPAETDGQAEAVIGGNDGIILVVRKA